MLDPRPPRTTARAVSSEPAWFLLQQRRANPRIIVHGPGVGQRTIHDLEVGPAAVKTSGHISSWHVVAALSDACRNPAQGQLRRRQTQEHELDEISGPLPAPKAADKASAAHRAIERKVRSARGQSVEFAQHRTAGRQPTSAGRNGDRPAAMRSALTKCTAPARAPPSWYGPATSSVAMMN
jgi:hypothetical protein